MIALAEQNAIAGVAEAERAHKTLAMKRRRNGSPQFCDRDGPKGIGRMTDLIFPPTKWRLIETEPRGKFFTEGRGKMLGGSSGIN